VSSSVFLKLGNVYGGVAGFAVPGEAAGQPRGTLRGPVETYFAIVKRSICGADVPTALVAEITSR